MNALATAQPTIMASKIVARFNGTDEHAQSKKDGKDPELSRFSPIFNAMISYEVEGASSEFLFFTPEPEEILGTYAWDIVSTSPEYGYGQKTKELIEYACQKGLIDKLPPNIKLVDNGPGTLDVFKEKTGSLVEKIQASEAHEVQSLVTRDKSNRYATESAMSGKMDFQILESIGTKGDFINDSTRFLEGQGTAVIATWGGPFANAPEYVGGPSALQTLEKSFVNMHKQHGFGSFFITEVDLPQDNLDLSYAVHTNGSGGDKEKRQAFKKFILGAFHRAAHNGTILDKNYDVEALWDVVTTVKNETIQISTKNGRMRPVSYPLVRLSAQPKKAHIINTVMGPTKISTDDAPRVQTLSHKWKEEVWRHAARQAGAPNVTFYKQGNKALMFGQFTKKLA